MTRDQLLQRAQSQDESLSQQTESLEAMTGALLDKPVAPAAAAADAAALGGSVDEHFAELGFAPDAWKAYMKFNLCRAFPNIAGPAMSGNYMGFTPRVLENSHQSLLHQQINLEHKLKAYNNEDNRVPRDRIVGCCVATSFPKPGGAGGYSSSGWSGIPESVDVAPEITGLAVLFKVAEGVNHFLGDHLSGKRERRVSIEMSCPLENMAIYRPSTREIHNLMDAPDELIDAISENQGFGGLSLGMTAAGEQLAWAYGGESGMVEFRGTGIVEYPADQTARIQHVMASRDQCDLCSLPADTIPEMLVGRAAKLVRAVSQATMTIAKVHTEGRVGPASGEVRLVASSCDPVVELQSLPGKRYWWRLSDVELLS